MDRTKTASVRCLLVIVSLAFLFAGCTGYMNYRTGLFEGSRCLREGDDQAALKQFMKASQAEPTEAMPLAMAGQVAYRMGDYERASCYLGRAGGLGKSRSFTHAFVIIKAYQSLIAFREDKKEEGMAALAEYVRVMGRRQHHPENSFYEVERMCRSGHVVFPRLEAVELPDETV